MSRVSCIVCKVGKVASNARPSFVEVYCSEVRVLFDTVLACGLYRKRYCNVRRQRVTESQWSERRRALLM